MTSLLVAPVAKAWSMREVVSIVSIYQMIDELFLLFIYLVRQDLPKLGDNSGASDSVA